MQLKECRHAYVIKTGRGSKVYTKNSHTNTITIGSTGLETVRTHTGSGMGTITRTVNARDMANREIQATVGITVGGTTYSSAFNAECDGAGQFTHQWGAGLSPTKPVTPSYTYGIDGKKVAESLPLTYGGALSGSYTYTLDSRLATASIDGSVTSYAYDRAAVECPLDAYAARRVVNAEFVARDGRAASGGLPVFGFGVVAHEGIIAQP